MTTSNSEDETLIISLKAATESQDSHLCTTFFSGLSISSSLSSLYHLYSCVTDSFFLSSLYHLFSHVTFIFFSFIFLPSFFLILIPVFPGIPQKTYSWCRLCWWFNIVSLLLLVNYYVPQFIAQNFFSIMAYFQIVLKAMHSTGNQELRSSRIDDHVTCKMQLMSKSYNENIVQQQSQWLEENF